MNKRKIVLTATISGVSFVVGYLINYFLTEYITDNAGTEAYGYVSLSKTIASYAIIGSAALNSYSSRFIAVEYHKKNYKKVNTYFSSVFWGNVFLGLVMAMIWLIITSMIHWFVSGDEELISEVRILFWMTFINLFLQLTGTAYQAASLIRDKLHAASFFRMLSYLIEGVSLLIMFAGFRIHIYFVAVGSIVATATILISNIWLTRKYTPNISLSIHSFDFKSMKELLTSGVWNSINTLGNTLNSGLDLIVTNCLLGAFAMGQVSIVKTFSNIFNALYSMITQPFQPYLLKMYALDNIGELIRSLKISMKVSGFISNIAFAGVVGYGLCYFNLWIPNQNTGLLYVLTIICVSSSIFEGAVYPLYYIYTLTVKNKVPSIITIVGGLFNVLGMVLMIKYTSIGIYSIFITTTVVMLLINGVTNPIYMSICLKVKWNTFYPELMRHSISTVVMTLVIWGGSRILDPHSWIGLILGALISIVVGGIIHCIIVFNPKELKSLLQILIRRHKSV